MADVINSAIDFLSKIREEKEVTIKFIKKNGEERVMKVTLDFTRIPKRDQPKSINLPKILKLLYDKKIIHVYDLGKNAWRSVPYDSVEWLETKKQRRFKVIADK